MKRVSLLLSLLLTVFVAVAAEDKPRDLDWLELMPKDEVDLLMNTPAIDHGGGDFGSDGGFGMEQQGSFRTVPELNDAHVRIPGYIVPVEVSEDQKMSGFFLVPYFGACIHVPPPPPNQIIYVTLEEAIPVTDIYDAYWVIGTLKVEMVQREIASSAYRIQARSVTRYDG